ncbi:MAG: septum formation initiator family protein [Oscillospiraceae bacterium]|jgi:cell division protein FtsB|nr:septum formation initiator family protein [Oscillospiraceae bacterium]
MDAVRTFPNTGALPRHTRERGLRREEHKAERRAHTRRAALSLPAVFFFAVIACTTLYIVYNYMRLSELTVYTGKQQAELYALKKENAQLKKKAEERVDLHALERKAVEEYGMVKPSAEDIQYVDLTRADAAISYEDPGFWETVKDSAKDAYGRLVEFLR